MRLKNEAQLLDADFRAMVIAEIEGSENQARKAEALKRYEIYKDKTKKYVIEKLRLDGLREKTLMQMQNRASNISLCKKVVNKLARTYSGGVSRETNYDEATAVVSDLSKLLETDQKMKKADRYRELAKNACVVTLPDLNEVESMEGAPKYNLKTRVMLPWQYDVIEDEGDREQMRVLIMSDFNASAGYAASEANAGIHGKQLAPAAGDKRDQVIADTPSDQLHHADSGKTYIWWSDSYHFTTDSAGMILNDLSPEGYENPIGKLVGVKVADEQDGRFWAEGGDDLIDGAVLVNTIITDMLAIAFIQGWGQIVITGKNINGNIAGGPHNAVIFEYDKENDPKPEFDIVNANPPIESWLKIIEQYVALLLTTNNLSPSTVSMKLDVSNMASGIAMIVEMSEATNDIEDKQKEFSDAERQYWEIVKRWHNYYLERDALASDFAELGPLPTDLEISVKFNDIKPVISEREKLEAIKLRQDLGINEAVDLILKDNADMTREQAEEKLMRIREEQANAITAAMAGMIEGEDTDDEEMPN